jgi:hypothetical protein
VLRIRSASAQNRTPIDPALDLPVRDHGDAAQRVLPLGCQRSIRTPRAIARIDVRDQA